MNFGATYTEKKEKQIFQIQNGAVAKSYMTNSLLNPYIRVNICVFPHIIGSPSSNMTFQLLHSEFPYTVYEVNLIFFFISVLSSDVFSFIFQDICMFVLRGTVRWSFYTIWSGKLGFQYFFHLGRKY
jgi:hypothetical protein